MDTLVLTLLLACLQLQNNAVTSATDFNCQNSLISESWREVVLKTINDLRRTVSKGEQKGQGNADLPKAKEMNELNWDCNIEAAAQTAAAECPANPQLPTYTAAGAATYKIGSLKATATVKASCDATSTTKDLLNTAWKTAVEKQADEKAVADNTAFSLIARDKADAFACTYQVCKSEFYLLCFFNQEAPAQGDVYTKEAADYCTGQNCNCVNALCQTTLQPAIFTSTICSTCDGEFSDNVRLTALDKHNYYRRLLATGWAKYGTNYAKPATKMIELQYEKTLEDDAKQKIANCPDGLAAADQENLWMKDGTGFDTPFEDAMKMAVDEWWAPFESTGFGDDLKNTAALKTAAYIAYDEATKIGCAVESCVKKGRLYILCKYDSAPAINAVIYASGNTCSKCSATASTKKCSTLGGLCVA
ncbi:hypothetical protein RB195_015770 [Necator americanus]|uniref:SCP domain-containing protein n=1 Tax=Necator americanus TaxID=51031 RepID=A0ABR1E6Q4_NECAM